MVFVGPKFVSMAIVAYTNGSVVPSKIKILPNLDVNIGRLEYNIANEQNALLMSGYSRSVDLSWSLWKDQPFFEVDLGPTMIKDVVFAESINIQTSPFIDFEWSNVIFNANLMRIDFKSSAKLNSLSIEGNFSPGSSMVSDLHFETQAAELIFIEFPWSSSLISGNFNKFHLDVPVSEQNFSGQLSAVGVSGSRPQVAVSEVYGTFQILKDVIEVDFDLRKVNLPEFTTYVESAKVNGQYQKRGVLKKLNLELSDGVYAHNVVDFSKAQLKIFNVDENEYAASAEGDFGKMDIYIRENYVGLLPPSKLAIDFSFQRTNAEITAISEIKFDDIQVSKIKGSVDLRMNLKPNTNAFSCLVELCELSNFGSNLKINLDDESLIGRSTCDNTPCDFLSISHSLTTSDTVEIIRILNESSILSPVTSVYLYGVLNSGQKVGNGHKLDF